MPHRTVSPRMVPRRMFLAVSAALTLLSLVAGCGGGSDDSTQYEYDTSDAASPTPAADRSPLTLREMTGHWVSSEYGDAYVQVSATEMKVVYGHDGGRMIGSLRGSTFDGWWSEAPTRKPSDDAGEVELTFTRNGGKLTAQGWWRPGTDTAYETDWTMEKVDSVIPAAVRANFADASQFVRHP